MLAAFLTSVLVAGEMPPEEYLPPASDLARFPSRQVADETKKFARRHRDWVAAQSALDTTGNVGWTEWYMEAERLRLTWGLLRDAHDFWWRSRWKLKRLRDLIGDYDYWLGAMPPPVPVGRFRRLP